ncbi:MAG: SDR family oxidoreductase [Eubacterium sp.]|nr:SDR family oxidoreductase [Eubacterium sp.]
MKKRVLITGVSKNIGKSICKRFVDEGYEVIGTYKSFFDEEENRKVFIKEFENVTLFKVDLTKHTDVSNFINKMKKYRFDVIINNAGILNMTDDNTVLNEFIDFDIDAFVDLINCNLISVARICIELKECIKNNGNIIIISSESGSNGAFASISYNASKAALINLTRSLSNNFAYYNNIRVNCVSPGWVETQNGKMNTNSNNLFVQKIAKVTPMMRNAKPKEIADVVYYLTTEQASFITGANIIVDGGYSNFDVIYYEESFKKSLLAED